MTPYQRRMNDFIRRMAEDMLRRNFAQSTIDSYTYHVDKYCQYFGRSAEELGPEHIREYQLYLVQERKVSWSSFNQAVCALRLLYQVTMDKDWTIKHIPFGKRPKKLPTVLADDEACKLIQAVKYPKHQTVLLTCYAAGLRLSEATHLRVADIDGQRKQLHIRSGKGRKARYVPASPRLLDALREFWKVDRPTDYLFPGRTPDVAMHSATIQKACKMAVAYAQITKPDVTPHTLRHTWATGMLEAGVDLLTISRLMGHSSFVTTMIYLHLRRPHIERLPDPLDWLPVRQCPQWLDQVHLKPKTTPPGAPE